MAVLRFDPFRGFENLSNKVGSMINEAEMGVRFEYGNFKPRVDILEDSEKIYVFAELAGVKKIDVKVTINEENMLIIKGDKRVVIDADSLNKESHIRRERTFGSFSRSFMLPENIKEDSISAKFENGILEVVLEKVEPKETKEYKVEIK